MKAKTNRAVALFLSFILGSIIACSQESKYSFDINSITSYRDIPGVTKEEINAVEALKASRQHFVFGHETTT